MQNPQSDIEVQLEEQGFPLVAKYHYGITGLAKKLASKYQQPNNEEDFCQVALLTACSYEKRFDETNGAGFYAFVAEPIKTSIQNEFGNPNVGSKVYNKLVMAIAEHQSKYNEYPTMDDLVIATKLSRFKIMEVYFDKSRDVSIDTITEEVEEDNTWVLDHLGILNDEEQKIVQLIFFEDLSLQEVSVAINKPVTYTSSTISTALTKLRNEIKGK